MAEQLKKDFYGNRIVMFAPLYYSNYSINGCVSSFIMPKINTLPEKMTRGIVKEVMALQDMGHKTFGAGKQNPVNEHPLNTFWKMYSRLFYFIQHKELVPMPACECEHRANTVKISEYMKRST